MISGQPSTSETRVARLMAERKLTLKEVGERVARRVGRKDPFKPGVVARWIKPKGADGRRVPEPEIIDALAAEFGREVLADWFAAADPRSVPSPAAPVSGAENDDRDRHGLPPGGDR